MRAPSEKSLLLLIGAVQFVNILDFMMVMPLGPDFARALGIPASNLGLIGGSYTASAAVSGLAGAFFLDRIDRKTALVFALVGLAIGTVAGGLATGLSTLLLARVVAGAFGGPATALSLAIIADAVPPERRGRAMGAVMGSFSVASVLGVPAGLELARVGGWRLPFFAVGALGGLVALLAAAVLPPLRAHLDARAARGSTTAGSFSFLWRPTVALSLVSTFVAMFGNFALIPNLSAYVQMNLGYPRERLGLLYLAGGVLSFGAMRVAGGLVDRIGPSPVAGMGMLLYVPIVISGFALPAPLLPVIVLFAAFMMTGSFRVVPMQALASRVPSADERARFMSAQSAVQHFASAGGAMLASRMLATLPDGRLEGMPRVAWLSVTLAFTLPFILWRVESRVRSAR
ncbi:MAG: MFS transporter [Polyangiaceae bacterium]|nr:MFS transporter [Polyangiaceae bacterium]